jgi:AraC family transcriptional regulator
MQPGGTVLPDRDHLLEPTPNFEAAGQLSHWRDLPDIRLRERVYPRGLRLAIHSHANAYLIYVLEGEYLEECEGLLSTCRAGTLRYLAAGRSHSDEFVSETRCLLVELGPDTLGRFQDCARCLRSGEIASPQASVLARRLVMEFRERDEAAAIAISGLVLEVLAESVRASGSTSRSTPKWLLRARAVIEAQFLQVPSLGAIARDVGVHPVHLSREFRRYFNCTVGEYMRKLRIDHAARLLASTSTPLAEIAEVCGFADQSHFSSSFKRTVGSTPARFRGMHA